MEEESEQLDEESTREIGKIEWLDLTVDEASRIRDFYCSLAGQAQNRIWGVTVITTLICQELQKLSQGCVMLAARTQIFQHNG